MKTFKDKTKSICMVLNDTDVYKRGDLVECEETTIEHTDFTDKDLGLKIIKKLC